MYPNFEYCIVFFSLVCFKCWQVYISLALTHARTHTHTHTHTPPPPPPPPPTMFRISAWWNGNRENITQIKHLLYYVGGITEVKLKAIYPLKQGARYNSVIRAVAYGAKGRRIDISWWTHWAISRSSHCSTTGVTKFVVWSILSMRWCI